MSITYFLGPLASVVLTTLFFVSARRLLQHSIAVWALRSEVPGAWSYEFTLQNLEAVPVNAKVVVLLREADIPTTDDAGPLADPSALRVYSGCTRPTFVHPRRPSNLVRGAWDTRIEFKEMEAFDTWSIRLRSPASAVTMKVGAGQLDEDESKSRFGSLGLDLSVKSVDLGAEKTVTEGPRRLPTVLTGVCIALIGPFLYGTGLWVLKIAGVIESGQSLVPDLYVALALAALGLIWFRYVSRPVLPAIQAYRSFWVPNSNQLQTEGTQE